jgi:hypothetical protein
MSSSTIVLAQSDLSSGTEPSSINKKIASRFIDRNTANVLEYQCTSKNLTDCSVVCNSGGNDYIKADNVRQAFYAERKSKVNGAVTGYNLVIDVAGVNDSRDIWATLQIESSCFFKGLTPKL